MTHDPIILTPDDRRLNLHAYLGHVESAIAASPTATWYVPCTYLRRLYRLAIGSLEELRTAIALLVAERKETLALRDRLADANSINDALAAEANGLAEKIQGEDAEQRTPFRKILDELAHLHDTKAADYGKDEDPLANIRAASAFGFPAWLGAIIRGNDKVARIQAFARKGKLANESVEDSLRDLAVYAIIALQLYREDRDREYAAEEATLSCGDSPGDEEVA